MYIQQMHPIFKTNNSITLSSPPLVCPSPTSRCDSRRTSRHCQASCYPPEGLRYRHHTVPKGQKRGKKRQPRNRYPGCSRDPGKWRRSCGRTESSSRIESTRQNDYPFQSRRRPQTRRNQGIETLADGLVV